MVASAYNKTLIAASGAAQQRIVLGGAAVDVSGADLQRQYVHDGVVKIETSRFLSGKTSWARTRSTAPGVPSVGGGGLIDYGGTAAGTLLDATYRYIVTACNEAGESSPFGLGVDTAGVSKVALSAGATDANSAQLTITAGSGTTRYYNIYRTGPGGSMKANSYKFIGRIASAGTTTVFYDLGNKLPGFVTGFLVQEDTMAIKELAPYSRLKLAVSDLSTPEAHFRFLSLAAFQPRKNVLIDSLVGSF
jgi:hypothetical protein